MSRTPGTMELAEKAGISKSYASEILTRVRDGDDAGRKPSRPLAIHILRTTGWRHPIIAGLSDEQIATLETIEPWVAPSVRPVEATPAPKPAKASPPFPTPSTGTTERSAAA